MKFDHCWITREPGSGDIRAGEAEDGTVIGTMASSDLTGDFTVWRGADELGHPFSDLNFSGWE